MDHALSFSYEPGSTFKAITVSGALQDGLVTPNTEFSIPPVLQVADRQIHDAESHGYETADGGQVLKVSSNIGADEIGRRSARPLQLLGAPVRLRFTHRRGSARRAG